MTYRFTNDPNWIQKLKAYLKRNGYKAPANKESKPAEKHVTYNQSRED